jgi:crotonobetainyl-CoA:carnitine CoA-transferase CaiB-like acyl-CoA transferase
MWHRFGFMDHQCALSSLLATLLALHERNRTGRGQAVAASLLGAGVLTSSETYRTADGTLMPYDTLDGDQTTLSSGPRIVEASDGWIALALQGADAVAVACAALQAADEAGLAASVAARSVAEVTALLAPAGIACEAVREQQRDPFFDDPGNRAAGLVAEYPHAEWGMLLQPGAMWHFGDLDVRLELAPPALGEHTASVLAQVGFSSAEITALAEQGAVVVRS